MENKTGKYLKYAIGEIVLVVIGILIALQINNWNQKQVNQQNEILYLNNLKKDLTNQIIEIDNQINYETRLLLDSEVILKRFEKDNVIIIDTLLIGTVNRIADRRTFNTINPTYVELINTGNMTLISDNSFKNQLISYHQEIERITEVIKLNNSSFIDTELGPEMRKIIPQLPYYSGSKPMDSLNYSNSLSKFNIDLLSQISSQKFKDKLVLLHFMNLVITRYDFAWFHIQVMNTQKTHTQELIKTLEKSVLE
jgi:hypothetical protein